MAGTFYQDLDGKIIRVMSEGRACSSETPVVVFEGQYDNYPVWVISKAEFYDNVIRNGMTVPRFKEISEKEACEHLPRIYWPKYHFPRITYTQEVLPLRTPQEGVSPGVRGMMSLLQRIGEMPSDFPCSAAVDDDIETYIRLKIQNDADLKDVFNSIQIWGGMSGRNIYVMDGGFRWSEIEGPYRSFVESCKAIERNIPEERETLSRAVRTFCRQTQNISIAFATKHAMFWTSRQLGENAFPIYDRVMAGGLMGQHGGPTYDRVSEYWTVMHEKALDLNITDRALERQLFLYYSADRG